MTFVTHDDWVSFHPELLRHFAARDDRSVVETAVSRVLGAVEFAAGSSQKAATKDSLTSAKTLIPRIASPVIEAIAAISSQFERNSQASLADSDAAAELSRLKIAVNSILSGADEELDESDPRKIFALACLMVTTWIVTAAKLNRGDEV